MHEVGERFVRAGRFLPPSLHVESHCDYVNQQQTFQTEIKTLTSLKYIDHCESQISHENTTSHQHFRHHIITDLMHHLTDLKDYDVITKYQKSIQKKNQNVGSRIEVLILRQHIIEPMQMLESLTFHLLTSWSVHAEVRPCIIGLPSLVSIAAAVFFSEH